MKKGMLCCLCIFATLDFVGGSNLTAASLAPATTGLKVVKELQGTFLVGGTILPADRRIPWDPGVPGGIPSYPVGVKVTDAPFGAKGDGVTDDFAAVTNAIAHCPNGTAVYFPAGRYLISRQLLIQNQRIALRGAGPDQTRLIFTDTSATAGGSIYFKGSAGTKDSMISGYTKDSRIVQAAHESLFNVGDFVKTEQDNDPAVLEGNIPNGIVGNTSRYYICQYNQIIAKSGSALTLRHSLYTSYNSAMNPRIQRIYMTTNCGVENLFLEQRGTRDSTILYLQIANCWVSGVESTNANWNHIAFDSSLACEARSNFLHHAQTYGQGGYGIDISTATDCLVEDNILYYLRHGIVIQDGASGNVVAYNYSHRVFDKAYPKTDYLLSDIEHHGGHPHMNLVEGNVCAKLTLDDYWGSSRNNTLFRNWVQRYSDGLTTPVLYGMWAIEVDRAQLYENILGNVLCRPGATGKVTTFGTSSYTTNPVYDPRITNTMIWHGNFDFVSGKTQWDPANPNHELPASLYLTAKPAYFLNLTWPPFGPGGNDSTPQLASIPAVQRWISRFGNP